jgi:hypothetical protein
MKKYLYVLFLLSAILVAESADEPSYIEKYLRGQVDVNPGPNWRYYYILAARDETPSQLVSLLKDTEKKGDWKDAIQALGILASGESRAVPLSWLTDIAENWESGSLFDSDEQLRYLKFAYSAIAYQGSLEALDFLKLRASEEYWKHRNMPTSIEVIDHPYSESKITARSKALLAIAQHPSPEAENFYKEAYINPKFNEDYLRAQLESNFRMRSTWLTAHKQRMEARELKRSEQSPKANIANEPAAQNPLVATELVEEVRQPEPAGIQEAAEAVVTEPIEEDVEQRSNWWLWLIGAVVVVGGILVLRSKK